MAARIFIVDDEAPARARLTTLLSDIATDCPHELVGQAGHAQEALDGIAAQRPDIVLLDIQMPGMSGIELAAHLASKAEAANPCPAIIFITAFDTYALKAFEVHAIDYLLKPVRASRLAEAVQRAIAMHAKTPPTSDASAASTTPTAIAAMFNQLGVRRQHFSVPERGRLLLVPIADVLYLKAELKYVTLKTRLREFVIEESLLSLEEELGELFARVHRNTLVARHAILGVERGHGNDTHGDGEKSLDAWQVILRDTDERLQISRRQWPIVKALVNKKS